MIKILLWLCLFILFIGLWKVIFKFQINQHFQQFKIKQLADLDKQASISTKPLSAQEARIDEVEEYEQQLFDDVCQIFFERELAERNLSQAIVVQEGVLRKMPAKTQTQIRKLDLGEWSIYWTFYDQSLEYYVGRYGVFYTHVDRFGDEHKFEMKDAHSHV
ncbi:hypothetical protein [Acinetobacter terrae]|uniref:Uncharacterized protein n=1 Tax=Acinetobacter terrae TaxID=2731247 RepID=A0A8E4F9Z7_9GAMM|nr:hypothetical protein [Acinetobacter terrae]NNH39709.1 hypothetical protein [Acinetobacter terrae]NNH87184.1 hypothetical protein [Acinetobacter terrae]